MKKQLMIVFKVITVACAILAFLLIIYMVYSMINNVHLLPFDPFYLLGFCVIELSIFTMVERKVNGPNGRFV